MDARQLILCRALELFSRHGYDGVGVQEIVVSAGVTKPTLYHHFGSKEGVFRAVVEPHFAMLDERLRKAARYDPRPQDYERDLKPTLEAIALEYFAHARENTDFHRLMLAMAVAPHESVAWRVGRAPGAAQYRIVQDVFEKAAGVHGNLRGRERLLAAAFIGAVNVQITLWYFGEVDLDDVRAAATVRLFMHGIFA